MCRPPTKNEEGLVQIWSVLLRNHQRKSENQETKRFFLSPFHLGTYFLFFFGNFYYSQIIPLCYITMSVIISHISLEIFIVYLFIFFSFHFTFECNNKKKQYMVSQHCDPTFLLCATLFMIYRYKALLCLAENI